ncbi:MAG TPA: peptidylprolyl isomerase [Planctomycetia bacterium]|nr:peptidylprolyl isomerase [Planctomycetia bacterium]
MEPMQFSALLAIAILAGDPTPPGPVGKVAARDTGGPVQVANLIARVDDKSIFLQDILAPVERQLKAMREQLPPAEYIKQERAILKAQAEKAIDRMILMKEIETKLKGDESRIKQIRKQIGAEFNNNLVRMARQEGIKSDEEMVKVMEQQGINLQTMRQTFIDDALASSYLRQSIDTQIGEPTRPEILEYYQGHLNQFQQNAQAKWRHIEIRIGRDPKASAEKAYRVQQRLAAGEDFAKVAKELSEGSSASSGGEMPSVRKGSYAEVEVDKAIFTQQVGVVSPAPLRGSESFHFVKVESRNDDGAKPFSEVQKEIVKTLKEKRFQALRKSKMDEFRKRHYVESIFDRPDDVAAGDGPLVR